MLSAISGAKQAKKDESGQNARLKRHYGVLDEATTELESLITSESALEGAVQKLHDSHRNDMKFALGNLLRKAKEVETAASDAPRPSPRVVRRRKLRPLLLDLKAPAPGGVPIRSLLAGGR